MRPLRQTFDRVQPWWLLVAFVVVRVVHLAEIVDSPAIAQHQWPTTDMATFDRWASHIRGGDFLSEDPPWILNGFQKAVASSWRAHDPSTPDDVALWQTWLGAPRFYQEPLYPYALAAWRSVLAFVDGALAGLLLQALLGLAGLWLMMRVVARVHHKDAALVAGALTTLCGPVCYGESLLLRETLATTLGWLVLDRWYSARASSSRLSSYVLVGIACGVAIAARVSFVPFAAFFVVAALLLDRVDARARMLRAVAIVAGVAIALSPIVVRNVIVDVSPFALVGGGGAVAFFAANVAGADPWRGLVLDADLFTRVLAEAGGLGTLSIARATLATHATLGDVIALFAAKLSAFAHDLEIPDNASFALYRAHAPVLRALFVGFDVALPLGVAGAVACVRAKRGRAVVVLALACAILPVVLQPVSRYRTSLLAVLVALAGVALCAAIASWRNGARRPVVVGGIAVAVCVALMHRPSPDGVFSTRVVDHQVAWHFWADPRVRSQIEAHDDAGAAETLRLFLRGASLSEGRPEIDALYQEAREQRDRITQAQAR